MKRFAEAIEGHFAWKVRRRKRLDRNPLLVTLQDKYAAKLYAKSRGVESAEVLWLTERAADLPFDRLPTNYFIKATHGQNWNIRCAASRLVHYRSGSSLVGKPLGAPEIVEASLTRKACVALCESWLSRRYSFSEWAYTHIQPRLIIEESLKQRNGDHLFDYRFYTFGGKVRAISLGSPHYRQDKLNVFLTPTWEPFELTHYTEALPSPLPDKPDTLTEMIAAAETLGAGVDFIRADLYDTAQGVRLGELTVYPQAGLVGTPTGCSAFNRWLGDQWAFAPYVASQHNLRRPGLLLSEAVTPRVDTAGSKGESG